MTDDRNRILIVDDDTSTLLELANLLRTEYKIYTVKDGISALEKAEEALPDLILLDIVMPDLSGFDVLEKLRSNDKTKNIPIIFITGHRDESTEIKGLSAGAVDYVHKPIDDNLVRLRVRNQIQLINQFRKIQHLSMSDELTGLPNRRCFEMRIPEEWDRASREQNPLSIMVLDIDHFKMYNDTFGHTQGDIALKMVADVFARVLKRPGDFAARWGGEEFIILLPNTDTDGAIDLAEEIREYVEDMDIPTLDGSMTNLTVSIGVNTRQQGQSGKIDTFIDLADTALYTAKNKGRNKVCFYEQPSDTNKENQNEPKQNIIFVVDDSDTSLIVADIALSHEYKVVGLSSAAKMFEALIKYTPDLILLDIEMPEMNGIEAIQRLKSNDSYADIPVIFLSGVSDAVVEAQGIELGAVDFIMKPFTEPVLLNRIKKHLDIDELVRDRTRQLALRTEQLSRRSEELLRLQNGIVYTLADLVESRDANTGGHIERTTRYIRIMIEEMMERGVYSDEIKGWDIDSVASSARLHDIGKISIPDSILNKPDKLTEEEFEVIKTHPDVGVKMIEQMTKQTGDAVFLRNAKIITAFHHEKWNGSGYPKGLKGTDIPLHGRMMAIVDVYDALVAVRPYKKAFSHEKALDIIMENSGIHFDPQIAEVFNAANHRIMAVMERFS